MTVYYITKFALTKGILKVDKQPHPGSGRIYFTLFRSAQPGKDAFTSLEEAEADADARRMKKIASLETQIYRLQKYVPKVVDSAVKS